MISNRFKLLLFFIYLVRSSESILNTKIDRKPSFSNKFIGPNCNLYHLYNPLNYSKASTNNIKFNLFNILGKIGTLCVSKIEPPIILRIGRHLELTTRSYALLPSFSIFKGNCKLKFHKNTKSSGLSDVIAVNTWNLGHKSPNKFNYISSCVNNFNINCNRTLNKHTVRRTFTSTTTRKLKQSINSLDNLEANKSAKGLNRNQNQECDSKESSKLNNKLMDSFFNKTFGSKANNQMGAKGKAIMSYFRNRQGLRIRTYASEVDRPKGKVFLVHGVKAHFRSDFVGYNVDWHLTNIGEYITESAHQTETLEKGLIFQKSSNATSSSEDLSTLDGKDAFDLTPRFKYEGSFLEYMNNLGYSVYGLDHQSHGLSESYTDKRCYFDKFDDLCYDLIQFISLVKRGNFFDTSQVYDHDQLFNTDESITTSSLYTGNGFTTTMNRCYLIGLSMGGNVVLRTMQLYNKITHKNLVDGLVCLAGMINIDYHYQGVIKKCFPCFRFFNKLNPVLGVGKAMDFSQCLSANMRGHDPLYFKDKMYLKMALMIYDATKTLESDFIYYPNNLPTLFIHSKDDMTCDVKGPRNLMAKYFKHSEIARFHEIEGAAHVVSSPLLTTVTGPLVQQFLEGLEFDSNL